MRFMKLSGKYLTYRYQNDTKSFELNYLLGEWRKVKLYRMKLFFLLKLVGFHLYINNYLYYKFKIYSNNWNCISKQRRSKRVHVWVYVAPQRIYNCSYTSIIWSHPFKRILRAMFLNWPQFKSIYIHMNVWSIWWLLPYCNKHIRNIVL